MQTYLAARVDKFAALFEQRISVFALGLIALLNIESVFILKRESMADISGNNSSLCECFH